MDRPERMREPAWARLRFLWLPALVAVVGTLASVGLWRMLLEERSRLLSADAGAVAEGVRLELEDRLAGQLRSLRHLASFWAGRGAPALDQAGWERSAALLIRQSEAFDVLAWVEPRTGRVWRAAASNAPVVSASAPPETRPEALARSERERLLGPLPLADGSWGYRVVVPAHRDGARAGALVGTVRAAENLARVLAAQAPRYAVRIVWDGHVIYSHGERPTESHWRYWEKRERIEVPLGSVWTVELGPTPALVAAHIRPLPHYVLAGGVVIALLLGAVVHEARLARARTRSVDRTNRELDRQIQEKLEAEAEIRQLNRDLEARVAERTRDLDEAVADLEAFNYSVSHDLKSPLGAVVNFTAVLEEDYGDVLDDTGRGFLRRVRDSAESALAMMEGLLDFSRLGRKELERSRVGMEELVRSTFEEVRAERGPASAELAVGPLPPVLADPAMLRLVVTNLLANALKFSRHRRPPRIEVRGEEKDGEVIYTVADNGAGFDMRFARKLFHVFERLHSSNAYEGTGVGLAIVARIVRRHGGRVWAEGELDRGAAFHFALPNA